MKAPKIRKFTVILTFPGLDRLTGFAMVHAESALAAEPYALGLFPEPVCGASRIVAVIPGWQYPERGNNSFAVRSYPVPLTGSLALPATSRPVHERRDEPMKK